jgi:hypothetical protein
VTANADVAQLSTRLIILDYTAERVLLLRDGEERLTLPVVETRDHWYMEITPIIDAARASLGLDLTAVQGTTARKIDGVTRGIWIMQARDTVDHAPTEGEWRPIPELRTTDVPDEERSAILRWLDGPPTGTPWLRPGWSDEPLGWARRTIENGGRAVTGEPQQFRHWSIASIWRIPTDGGDVWFKAVPPMFAREGAVIELIAESMPEHLPQLIARNSECGWTLLEALPAGTLRTFESKEQGAQYDEPVRVLARLQQAWIGREEALFDAGCDDRRVATLPAAIDELLASDFVRSGLTAEELIRLAEFAKGLPDRIEELRACGVPETLIHGDFHAGNIAVEADEIVIYDWTDACVSHPFFDMPTFLPRDPVERAGLLETYLSEWQAFATADEIERAWELAEPLACIHHALSYKRILESVEPSLRWEFDSDVTFWLKWLRDLLDTP